MQRAPGLEKKFHIASYTAGLFREEKLYRSYLKILKKGGQPKSISKEVLEKFRKRRERAPENDFLHVDLASLTRCLYLVSVVWNSNWYQEKFLSILLSTFAPFDQNTGAADTDAKRESVFLMADGELHAENLMEMFDAICQFAAERIKKESETDPSDLSRDALQKKIAPIVNFPLRKFAREACLTDSAVVDDRVEWLRQHAAGYILYQAGQDKKKKPGKCGLEELPLELKQWFIQQADRMGERWFRENDYTFLLGIRACGVGADVIADDSWFKLTPVQRKIDFLNDLFREGKIHFRIERWQEWAEKTTGSGLTEQTFFVAMRAVENMVDEIGEDSKSVHVLSESIIHDLKKSTGVETSIRSFLSGQPEAGEFLKRRTRWPFYLLKESKILPEVAHEKGIMMTFYPVSDEPRTMRFFRTEFEQRQPDSTLKGWQPIDLTAGKKLSASEFIKQLKGIHHDYFVNPEEVLKFYYMTEDERLLYRRNYGSLSELAFVNHITGGGIHNRDEAERAITALNAYLTHDDLARRNATYHQDDKEKAIKAFIKSMKEIFEDKAGKLEIALAYIVNALRSISDITSEQRALFIMRPADGVLKTKWISDNLKFLLQSGFLSSAHSTSTGFDIVWQFYRKIIILTCAHATQEFYQPLSKDDKKEDPWERVYRTAQAKIESEINSDEQMPWFLMKDVLPPTGKARVSTETKNSENGYLTDRSYRKNILNKVRKLLVRVGYRLPTQEARIELRGQVMLVMLGQYVTQFTNSDLKLFETYRLTVDVTKKIADIMATEIWSIIIDLIKDEIIPPPLEWLNDNTDEHGVGKDIDDVFLQTAVQTDSDAFVLDRSKNKEDLECNELFDNPEITVDLSEREKINISRYIDFARDKALGYFDKAVRQLKRQRTGLKDGELKGNFLSISTQHEQKLNKRIYPDSISNASANGRTSPIQATVDSTESVEIGNLLSLGSANCTIFPRAKLDVAFGKKHGQAPQPSINLSSS